MLSHFSHVRLFVTPWTVAHQAPLSMGFFRQEYWSRLQCPPPGDLPNQESNLHLLTSPALAGRFFTINTIWEAPLLDLRLTDLKSKIGFLVYTSVVFSLCFYLSFALVSDQFSCFSKMFDQVLGKIKNFNYTALNSR